VTPYRIADHWEQAFFQDRPNRFTLVLSQGDKKIRAYLPNTGRLEEYLVEGSRFFITPFHSPKFRYRVVSTLYQGNHVLLDTVRMNSLVAAAMEQGLFPWLQEYEALKRETTVGNSRFDFCIERSGMPALFMEVKTCTLIHHGIAMFPDAPTLRARAHLAHLGTLQTQGFETLMLFVLPSAGARLFRPNHHTDPDFSKLLQSERSVSLRAVSLELPDPVTVDMDTIRDIPIDLNHSIAGDRGSYMLVLHNSRPRTIEVGRLGSTTFRRGYYVYVGSGLGGLTARIDRHKRVHKKQFWHIDYLTTEGFTPVKSYAICRTDRIEQHLAARLGAISREAVPGFGSSDSAAASHLFYFQTPPFRDSRFMDIVLDFRMGTE
jgi:sugar fermentation stimulation protein A